MAAPRPDREARTRNLYRYISEAIRKVDEGTSQSKIISDLFSSPLEIHRQRLRDNCEKLIFADPLLYGRKGQELLWRKGYYETVSTAKRLRNGDDQFDMLILNHLNMGIGHYHHLIFRLQLEMDVDLKGVIDYPLINLEVKRENKNNENEEMIKWAKTSIQLCFLYLGDLTRYKSEYERIYDCSMAARYYLQAVDIDPKNGMPYNQLGTLYTGKNHYLDSIRYYIICMSCESPFDGAESNILRILDKNNKYLESEGFKNHGVDQQESIKNFVCKFLSVIECWYFSKNFSNFNELCTTVLYDLKECLNLDPLKLSDTNLSPVEHMKYVHQQEITPDHLNSTLLNRIIIIILLSLNKFSPNINSEKTLSLKAFTLAIFSQLLQKMLSDLTNIGFTVQSPREIVEERKEKIRFYKSMRDQLIENSRNCERDNLKTKINNTSETSIEKQDLQSKSEDISIILTEDISEKMNGETIKENEHPKISKEKQKKSNKLRRRKRRTLNSDESESENSSSFNSDSDSKSELSESEMDDDNASEASYFTYTSSDFEHEEINDENNISNNFESIENQNGFNNHNVNDKNFLNKNDEKNDNVKEEEEKEFNEKLFNEFLNCDNILLVVNILFTWLHGEEDFLIYCRYTADSFFQILVKILNIVNRQVLPRLIKCNYILQKQYNKSLYKFHEVLLKFKYKYKLIPLSEDYDVKSITLMKEGLKNINWDMHKYTELSKKEANAVRFLRMIDFGIFIVKLDFGIIFNRRLKMYTFKRMTMIKRNPIMNKKFVKETRTPIKTFKTTLEQTPSNSDTQNHTEGLIRNLGKLWLSAQVQKLENEVFAGRHIVLPAYIVVDAEALSKQTYLVKRLVSSKRLIVLVPSIVLQVMDELKKESGGARSAIRWLEFQLRNGSRFLRTQRTSETTPLPTAKYPKKMNRDIHNFVQILEFCNYFINQEKNMLNDKPENDDVKCNPSGNSNSSESSEKADDKSQTGEADNSNILILLTGVREWEVFTDQNDFNPITIANSVGIAIDNIENFCLKTKGLFTKSGKNR